MERKNSSGYNKENVKAVAKGREIEILECVAGIPIDFLDGKHHTCPKCGGKDRFRSFNDGTGGVICNQCFKENNGDYFAVVQWMQGVDFPEALRLIGDYLGMESQPTKNATYRTVKTWTYTDLNDKPVYYVDRKEGLKNGKPDKKFVQYRKVNSQTVYNLDGITPIPLNWKAITERIDETLFIVEGEKCCDALTAFGLLATSASGGSNTKIEWSNYVQNRQVAILPDQDKPGYQYALDVATSLWGSNQIKIVFLPGLAEKEDIADWIDREGTKSELLQIVESTPVWDGLPFSYASGDTAKEPAAKGKKEIIRRPRLINPAELEEKEIDWLWFNKIVAGCLNLLAGLAGIQKTFWSVYLRWGVWYGTSKPQPKPRWTPHFLFRLERLRCFFMRKFLIIRQHCGSF